MYAAALHILGNHSDADDATQEAFVRAYRALATFDGRADFFTWLYRIAVNEALRARKRRSFANADALPEVEAPPPVVSAPLPGNPGVHPGSAAA